MIQYQPLFDWMYKEHDMILVQSEMDAIMNAVRETNGTGVTPLDGPLSNDFKEMCELPFRFFSDQTKLFQFYDAIRKIEGENKKLLKSNKELIEANAELAENILKNLD